jgi:hypothetical protein
MAPSAAAKNLDRNMAKLLVYSSVVEIQSIELEVFFAQIPTTDRGLGSALRRILRIAIATEILLNFLFWQMKVVAFVTRGSREIKTKRLFHVLFSESLFTNLV